MANQTETIKCQIKGCNDPAVFHITSKNVDNCYDLCFHHASLGKDQNFSELFLKTGSS